MLKSVLRLAKFPVSGVNLLPDKIGGPICASLLDARGIHLTSSRQKEIRIGHRDKLAVSAAQKKVILEGETTIGIESSKDLDKLFPDDRTPDTLFDGVPYQELPIINIKSTPNNTIMTVSDHTGLISSLHSAGVEGFKNAKKGTNIAAQQAALTFGSRTIQRGIRTIRLRVQGIGPGRMSAIKGLQLAGMNIVSITDDTRVSWHPQRPRKARRL